MSLLTRVIVAAIILSAGVALFPRPDPRLSADELVAQALESKQPPTAPMEEISRCLASGCKPILEGSDRIAGADVWVVRLRIPPPKKYPWIELWIEKKRHTIVAWKEWGKRDGKVSVLQQSSSAP